MYDYTPHRKPGRHWAARHGHLYAALTTGTALLLAGCIAWLADSLTAILANLILNLF